MKILDYFAVKAMHKRGERVEVVTVEDCKSALLDAFEFGCDAGILRECYDIRDFVKLPDAYAERVIMEAER